TIVYGCDFGRELYVPSNRHYFNSSNKEKGENKMNRKLFVVMQIVLLALVGSAVGTAAGRLDSTPRHAQHSLGMASNASPLTPVGSGFTYQGRRLDCGNPANGSYDFQIILYDALVGGNQIGTIMTATNQLVTDGSTTLTLDFGAGAFDGNGR